jgi:hypothetical protein
MFVLIEKIVAHLYLQKNIGRVHIGDSARLFVLASLLQVHAIARAIQRDFALLTATLRANAAMDGRTETLFFALFANCTTH